MTKNTKKKTKKPKKSYKYIQKGGLVIDIPPIDISKFGPVEIIHELVSKSLNMFVSRLIKNKSATSDLYGLNSNEIVEQILQRPSIQFRINTIAKKISSQINLSILMGWNAIIGFIPVPIIPGLIRNFNNGVYQIIKIFNKAKEYNEIKNNIVDQLKEKGVEVGSVRNLANQTINETAKQAETVMKKVNQVGQNLTDQAQANMKLPTKPLSISSTALTKKKLKSWKSRATKKGGKKYFMRKTKRKN
tara:strand:+ start:2197 stop:2934 length:738 start_codon:yes stop_codon:yes gene_type:complete